MLNEDKDRGERKDQRENARHLLVLTNQPSLSLSLLNLMKWQLLGCSRGLSERAVEKDVVGKVSCAHLLGLRCDFEWLAEGFSGADRGVRWFWLWRDGGRLGSGWERSGAYLNITSRLSRCGSWDVERGLNIGLE